MGVRVDDGQWSVSLACLFPVLTWGAVAALIASSWVSQTAAVGGISSRHATISHTLPKKSVDSARGPIARDPMRRMDIHPTHYQHEAAAMHSWSFQLARRSESADDNKSRKGVCINKTEDNR
ncbi:uncharacterized protein LY79DRAFT_567524 [Colletotrichum navitas]|uniref:Uncharacterized protein n=1 Tax=Colletotrichum navitas TaxID=681940 RepID=A0AAD8V115_9PEZI|nr:uncharacterized protein LY79DRAFT_567524 [Colletotrichum navitas]KAK1573854.1 hypothetical protein LY79DRAFT_567524 [Colletotrichum navitas]